MKKHIALFRMRYIHALQHRAEAFSGIANQFSWIAMEALAFLAFYRANPAGFPMTLSQTLSYIWLQHSLISLFRMGFWEMDICAAIEQGSIAYELVRPMSLYDRWFSQIISHRLSRTTLGCVPVLLTALLLPEPYGLALPISAPYLLAFILSAAISLLIVAAFSMLMYISVFYTMTARGLRIIFTAACGFLSGEVIPLPFFPDRVRTVVEFLPFASMQNMPLRIYIGDISGADAFFGIGLQLFWLISLILLGKHLMERALSKVSVQGG